MNQNKFSFESENLQVDYISLNISGSVDLKPIAKYLFKQCHFNSMINSAGREKRLYYENTNQHRVSFRPQEYNPDYKSFWHGTQMIFKGDNAAQFYKLIKAQKFQWNILNLEKIKIGRFDINYFLSDEFESHPIIGGVKVRKKGKFLMVGISIAKLLYNYQYPFVLPTSFLCYKNRYDLHVKIEILRAFCSRDIKKQINLENFLKQFSVPNRQVKQIKILLLKGLHELQQFIQPSFVITKKNGNLIETKQLKLRVIKQARIISFKEAIKITKFNSQYLDP